MRSWQMGEPNARRSATVPAAVTTMPSKRQKHGAPIPPPHLPKSAPAAAFPDSQIADHGLYADLVLAHAGLAGHVARDVTFEEVHFNRVRMNGTLLIAPHLRDVRFDTCDLAEADWE